MVVTSHGETLADDRGAFQRSRQLREGLRRAVAEAESVTAPSEYVLDDLRRQYGLGSSDGRIVRNGVDPIPLGQRAIEGPPRDAVAGLEAVRPRVDDRATHGAPAHPVALADDGCGGGEATAEVLESADLAERRPDEEDEHDAERGDEPARPERRSQG